MITNESREKNMYKKFVKALKPGRFYEQSEVKSLRLPRRHRVPSEHENEQLGKF